MIRRSRWSWTGESRSGAGAATRRARSDGRLTDGRPVATTRSWSASPESRQPLTLPSPLAGARDQHESLSLGEGEGRVRVALSRESSGLAEVRGDERPGGGTAREAREAEGGGVDRGRGAR